MVGIPEDNLIMIAPRSALPRLECREARLRDDVRMRESGYSRNLKLTRRIKATAGTKKFLK